MRRLSWRSGFRCAGERGNELGGGLVRCGVIDDTDVGHAGRDWHVAGEALGNVGFGLTAAGGQALGEDHG